MQYDIVIVGGGLVGAGLACALSNTNLKIALIDARKNETQDARLFALSETTCQFLKNIKLWPELASHAAAIKSIQVSIQKRFGVLRLNADEVNLPQLGFVIPASYIETAFEQALSSLKNLTVYKPALLTSLTEDGISTTLNIETETGLMQLHAPIVFAADGTESNVRKQLNIETETVDYQQTAIVTRTLLKQPHHGVAYERFANNGALAMLPLIGNECATIWSVDHTRAHQLMAASDEEFLQQLQTMFGSRLGKLQKITKRYSYPLRLVRAKTAVHKNVFLLGNAAHTLHPIAAQGFNLALYEVAMLAEMITRKTKNEEDITMHDLQTVAKEIEDQQRNSITVSHQLAQLFARRAYLSSLIFPLGFVGLNAVTPLKRSLLNRLLGRNARTPRLLLKNEF